MERLKKNKCNSASVGPGNGPAVRNVSVPAITILRFWRDYFEHYKEGSPRDEIRPAPQDRHSPAPPHPPSVHPAVGSSIKPLITNSYQSKINLSRIHNAIIHNVIYIVCKNEELNPPGQNPDACVQRYCLSLLSSKSELLSIFEIPLNSQKSTFFS